MNQRDIARLAGVSSATVSRVINNDPRVDKQTAEKVKRIIEENGYIHNAIARNLRSAKTNTVGFIVVDTYNEFFSHVFGGIDHICQQNGYNVIIQNTDEDISKEEKAIRTLCRYRVDGVIASFVGDGKKAAQLLESIGIPLVLYDRKASLSGYDCVVVDNVGGIEKIVDYLIYLGHKRIAIICGHTSTSPGFERLQGYYNAMKKAGLKIIEEYIKVGSFFEEWGYKAAVNLLELPNPPTAIISSNNLMSIGAFKALKDFGKSIPKDISLIGFDDFQLASHLDPPITVVTRPMKEMGEIAAKLLFGLLDGSRKLSDKELVVLPTQLCLRNSCSSPFEK